jgi:hypothetical protein
MADHQYVPRPTTVGGGASERATTGLATQPDVRAMMRGAEVGCSGLGFRQLVMAVWLGFLRMTQL